MSKRTNSIVAVTIAKYATVYVEAESPEEAMKTVSENLGDIYGELMSELDDQFEESSMEVHSCDAYTTDAEDYMDYIWADGEVISYDEYMDELEDQEDEL